MKNKEKEALNNFLGSEKEKDVKKAFILNDREGLIERIDVTLIDKKGRQLLREQY